MISPIEISIDRVIAVRCEVDDDIHIIMTPPEETILVRVGEQGPPGTADKFYDHDQMIPSTTWTINHNLNKYPSIMIVDSAGNVVEGNIQEVTAIQAILTFTSAFAGHAYCN